MFSLNRAQIVGNITRDPEMRYTPNGQAVCSFSVATNRRWKDNTGNAQEATEFHNIVAWGKLAEITSQYLHKGSKVYVEGRLQTRSWEAQDGSKRQRTEIVAENFIFLSPKGAAPEQVSAAPDGLEEFPTSAEAKADKPTKDKSSKKEKEDLSSEASAKDDDINLDEIPF